MGGQEAGKGGGMSVLRKELVARPLSEWHEDYGPVLWWSWPVSEPPYVGTPLDEDWMAYFTHWTPLVVPLTRSDMRGSA